MKTVKSLVYIAATGCSAFLFSGNTNATVNVVPMSIPGRAILEVVVPPSNDTWLYLSDEEENNLYCEEFSTDITFRQWLDLSNLNNGVYTIYSRTDNSENTEKVWVKDESVILLRDKVEYRPEFTQKGDELMVSYFNPKQRNIEITLRSSDDMYQFYDGDLGNSRAFNKKFDLSRMPRGEPLQRRPHAFLCRRFPQ